jgi:serine protease Do
MARRFSAFSKCVGDWAAMALLTLLCPYTGAQSDSLAAFDKALEDVVARVTPAVVQIESNGPPQNDSYDNDDDGGGNQPETHPKAEPALGSGVILDPAGYIVTNSHLVRGTSSLTVILDNYARNRPKEIGQGLTLPARLIADFKEADLAIIKIDAEGLPTIPFSGEVLRQGQLVIAVGSPEGLQSSVSIGVVSSTNRQVTPDGHLSYVQTDAAINPGNSGGALVDIQGKLVGINSFFFTEGGGSDGLGFAIPSRLVQFVYQSIRQNGRVPWGDTGVRVQGITHTLATGLHLARKSGVVVADVVPGTPAERLGIKVGDIIASLDEQPLDNVPEYYETMYHKTVGQSVVLGVQRKSKLLNLKVPIVAPATENENRGPSLSPTINLVPKLGVLCSELGARANVRVAHLRSRTGVLVEARVSDLKSNLRAGDVIRAVNLRAIYNVGELESILDKAASTSTVLQIERNGRFLYLPLETN